MDAEFISVCVCVCVCVCARARAYDFVACFGIRHHAHYTYNKTRLSTLFEFIILEFSFRPSHALTDQ